jgi:hypothetical protein
MYLGLDLNSWILMIISVLITLGAQIYVNYAYGKYKTINNSKGLTGFDVARTILDNNGLKSIYITETSGMLSDHYDPTKRVVKLSKEIYRGKSIASISVAAHEVGHALQDKDGYSFLKFRMFIFPLVNFASKFGYIAIFIGFIFSVINLIWTGIGLLFFILLFQLVTLPVEFNASRRAIIELNKNNLLNSDETSGSKSMLKAAAMTYVAGVATTLLELLRLILMVSGRDDR